MRYEEKEMMIESDILSDKILKKLEKDWSMRKEFDDFMIAYRDKYNLPQEAYKALNLLNAAYITCLNPNV